VDNQATKLGGEWKVWDGNEGDVVDPKVSLGKYRLLSFVPRICKNACYLPCKEFFITLKTYIPNNIK
jgi:hypothetical protein